MRSWNTTVAYSGVSQTNQQTSEQQTPPPRPQHRTNGAAAPHPGTFPGRSQGREALSAPRDPSTCHQRPRPWECGTQLVRWRHLCLQAVKERRSPPVVPGAHPSPCVRSRGTGGQCVSVTKRMRCPGPLLPVGLSVRLPWPPHRAWSTRPHLPRTHKAQAPPTPLPARAPTHRTTVSSAHLRFGGVWWLSIVHSALEPDSHVVQPRGGVGKEAHTRGPAPA